MKQLGIKEEEEVKQKNETDDEFIPPLTDKNILKQETNRTEDMKKPLEEKVILIENIMVNMVERS